MESKALESYTVDDVVEMLREHVDALVLVDNNSNKYRSISRKGIFSDFLDETGTYRDLIEKLWFHLGNSGETITAEYKAFVSYYGEFKGKYSRRLNIFLDGSDQPHVVSMTVYPIEASNIYIFTIDELDDEDTQELTTTKKVTTIQNTYLFSMYVDLIRDTTSSISVTEISNDTVNASIPYSQWRMMTVNMIWPEDQKQFLRITDPEYLKENLEPGRTTSIDCQMKNLEGVYIWVKLIFSRAETSNDEDFRFVFMVQDINENFVELMSTLKKYEDLALKDPLTGLFNHGGIKTEIYNSIDNFKKSGEPVSLMMIDLDHFKNVNDTYGHQAGDNALKLLAKVLLDSVEGKKAVVGRYGGEEFVICLTGLSDEETFDLGEKIRKKVEETNFQEAGHVTCSVGISQLEAEDSFDDVFGRIDKAMYASKEAGRNKVTKL